ncbi:hypothetical protein AYK61_26825 [Rhodococcus sp. SBT000017]|uniref:hypothetical protein n=1 Tax=Rhodococcus sp. SBT000017 TaxID=1803385 RepID=UPI000EF94AFD|nr:hypothetical protein [Rhodococcus sp. SBT000017]RMB69763.1 hypothetical protein AYK61_26825 [Rhodococcus sp. SBT000017]
MPRAFTRSPQPYCDGAVLQRVPLVSKLARLTVVAALLGLSLVFGPAPAAWADGFECKEVPAPQSPNATPQAVFDSSSADAPTGPGFGSTGYGTHGWAGLKWYTYDLGCGEDITGVSLVRSKTDLGNTFLTVGQSFAAAAFWLDDQANTPAEGEQNGRQGAIAQFDDIVYAMSDALRPAIFGPWLGIGIGVAGLIVLYRALRSDAAGVTRQLAIGAAGLALGGLMVGAPQKAISIADSTLMSFVTDTQGQIFEAAGVGPDQNPRLVITDHIINPDIRKGYFGSNASEETMATLWPTLRMSLAYTYDEQQRIKDDNSAQKDIDAAKKKMFQDQVVAPLEENGLSYYTFQGKDSSRVSIGFLSMVKTAMPSLLWIGASVLKISALLAIRLAVLTAPVWIPMAVVSGSLLARVGRIVGSIYLWAFAAAVIMSIYLFALIKLFDERTPVDGTWRLWFLIILTAVFWMVMRPFKRLSQTITQNSRGAIGGALHGRRHGSWKQNLISAGSMIANPAMGIAEKAIELGRSGHQNASKGFGGQWDALINPNIAHVRQEGRAKADARTDDYRIRSREAQMAALHAPDRSNSIAADLSKAPIDDVAGTQLPGIDLSSVSSRFDHSAIHGLRADTTAGSDGQAFTDGYYLASTGDGAELYVPQPPRDRWDGGAGAAIAPVTVYRPDSSSDAQTSSSGTGRPWVSVTRAQPASASTRPSGGTAVLERDQLGRANLDREQLGRRSPGDDRPSPR